MNHEFLTLFLEKTQFPDAAKESILAAAEQVGDKIMPILAFYEDGYKHEATVPLIKELRKSTGTPSATYAIRHRSASMYTAFGAHLSPIGTPSSTMAPL